MSGAWSYRLLQDANDHIHLAYIRYRPDETLASGTISIFEFKDLVGTPQQLIEALRQACSRPVVDQHGNAEEEYDADTEESELEVDLRDETWID
jgi:hypothetical protein